MSFTNKIYPNVPNVMKNFSDEAPNKSIQKTNAILRAGKLEVRTAIAIAISKVKGAIANYNEKRINNIKIHYY